MSPCGLRSLILLSIPTSFRRFGSRETRIFNHSIVPTTHLRRYSSHHQDPPQQSLLSPITVSKREEVVGQTPNLVDDTTDDWLTLDRKVNSYPTNREFTAIGLGGDDFVQAMVVAVESVLQQKLPEGLVKQKISSKGKYVSVTIGPVEVASSEQVQAVYNAMRSDSRRKYSL